MNRLLGRREPLSNVDAAWLRMEDPTNLMMVSGVLTFEEPIEFEELKGIIERRLLRFDRFRQRVVEPRLPLSAPYWEDDPHFDLNAHLHRVALPAPGNHEALQEMASDLMSAPLDYAKPLWHIHLIENYESGCAVMARLHHCIADGMALMFVLLSMTEMTPDATTSEPPAEAQPSEPGRLDSLFKQATTAVSAARGLTGKLLQEGVETISHPSRIIDLARQGGGGLAMATKMVLRWPDPKTLFKGQLGVRKRAAWSRPIALKDVKAIRKVTGGTVNDVLLTAMTGGLRRYMESHGESPDGINFRAAVPVNLRHAEEMGQLGNKFGLVFLSLPVGIADPLDRLGELKRRMDALKGSTEAVVAFGILNAVGMTTHEIQRLIVTIFGSKTTAVMTNVPGPPIPLYLAGREIKDLMFWVPQSGRLGLGVSILSYAGKVFLGVATDAGLVPDPELIIEGFYQEFEALMDLYRAVEHDTP